MRQHRDDGAPGAGPGIESSLASQGEKKSTTGTEALDARGFAQQHSQGREGSRCEGGSHPDAIQEARCQVSQIFDQHPTARDIAPTSGQCLAEGAHPDVHIVTGKAKVLSDSQPASTQNPKGMRFVHHQPAAVPVAQVYETRKVWVVSVHAVEAFDYHEGWDFVVTRYIDEDNDPLTWRIEPEPRCDGDLVRDRMKGEYADIRECLLEIARELL